MIEVAALTKRFGTFSALQGISFTVRKGSVTAFLGLNGAGKTTTLRILSCFLPPSSGSVSIAGFDVVRASIEVRRRIGYLPEAVPLHLEMRVGEYLRFRARLKGVPAREVTRAVDESAKRCRVDDVLRRPIGALSKGYRQRVGLADAVVHRPEVLILDEPTSGLDPQQRIQVRELVREMGSERTVLISTHIIPEVEATCDHVVIIHRGRIVADAPIDELRGGSRIVLEWRGAPVPGSDALGNARFRLLCVDAADASAAASRIVRAGGELCAMRPEAESLEAAFTRATSGSDA